VRISNKRYLEFDKYCDKFEKKFTAEQLRFIIKKYFRKGSIPAKEILENIEQETSAYFKESLDNLMLVDIGLENKED
jgi:hypothetical protein